MFLECCDLMQYVQIGKHRDSAPANAWHGDVGMGKSLSEDVQPEKKGLKG